ncbi:MAG: HNH nuclease family protein [Desulfatibacillum sp.]|nr:HNH nuclease family protein [Desulfatibacillum sp.]
MSKMDGDKAQIVAQALAGQKEREKGYRHKALSMYPHVCGKCGRDFEGKRVQELTVHHRDHNHDNNPPDGSNWELLCVYCHEDEHSRHMVADAYAGDTSSSRENAPSMENKPFGNLAALLQKKSK